MKIQNHSKSNGNTSTLLNQNKRHFIEAVKLMAPGNKFIADVARRVPQDMLPAVAGVAAFELASTLEMLCKSWRLRRPLEARPAACHSGAPIQCCVPRRNLRRHVRPVRGMTARELY
jgi:hypothetical protein